MEYVFAIITLLICLTFLGFTIFFITLGLYGPAACVAAAAFLVGIMVWHDCQKLFGKK